MSGNCTTREKPKTFKEFMTSSYFWRPFAGFVLGGIGGFLYYYFIGCSSGSCAITSNPYSSVAVGSFLGYFLLNGPCSRKC